MCLTFVQLEPASGAINVGRARGRCVGVSEPGIEFSEATRRSSCFTEAV